MKPTSFEQRVSELLAQDDAETEALYAAVRGGDVAAVVSITGASAEDATRLVAELSAFLARTPDEIAARAGRAAGARSKESRPPERRPRRWFPRLAVAAGLVTTAVNVGAMLARGGPSGPALAVVGSVAQARGPGGEAAGLDCRRSLTLEVREEVCRPETQARIIVSTVDGRVISSRGGATWYRKDVERWRVEADLTGAPETDDLRLTVIGSCVPTDAEAAAIAVGEGAARPLSSTLLVDRKKCAVRER